MAESNSNNKNGHRQKVSDEALAQIIKEFTKYVY